MQSHPHWHRWIPRIAFVGALFILGGLALTGPMEQRIDAIGPACQVIADMIWYYGPRLLPLLLIATSLVANRRRRWLALACLAIAFLVLCQFGLNISGVSTRLFAMMGRWLSLVYSITVIWIPYIATVAALVCIPRLRGWGWVVQALTVISLATFEVLHAYMPPAMKDSHDGLIALGSVFFGAMAIVGVLWTGWATMFRQIKVGRTPSDSATQIALTCPRCAMPQKIGIGEGECDNCRLQIYISVEEGTCHLCGYRLRGLAGDKCPECGTSIVVGAEA